MMLLVATRVRSYSKINLGLAIGPPRADGFHALRTLYQTLALHDVVTVAARRTRETRIVLRSNDSRVPLDGRNTAWKMVDKALAAAGLTAEVVVDIEKRLPVQGGMGAGSANAAAALLGLERELGLNLPDDARMRIAAEVGSDVPLFLIGGAVLGEDRGQVVRGVEAVTLGGQTEIACCVALPHVGVSTPTAFRDWDARFSGPDLRDPDLRRPDLHRHGIRDTLEQLSRTYASVFRSPEGVTSEYDASGIFPELESGPEHSGTPDHPEKQQDLLRKQHYGASQPAGRGSTEIDLAGNLLPALVRTGIENDFETVVFAQHPPLREIKQHLVGFQDDPDKAVYAALSGSGSALFGLYRTDADAERAQQRCRQHGVTAVLTKTMPRPLYWDAMYL